MFEIVDEKGHAAYDGLELECVTGWKKNYWKCMTGDGYYLDIRIKLGIVYFDLHETEHELGDSELAILKMKINIKDYLYKKEDQIDFEEIKKVMNFSCNCDQIWDI